MSEETIAIGGDYIRLTGFELSSFCQHRRARIPVYPGLTAVIGPNGSGKTNLLRGLMFGLTGLVDGSWGSQGALQLDGAVTPGWTKVELCGRDMRRYTLFRPVSPSGKYYDQLEVDGKVVARRRKAVDAALEELLGVPPSLLFRVAWGRQGELAQLLVAPAATVSTFLAQVFDTRFVETIRDRVKSQLDTVATLTPVTEEQLRSYRDELAALPGDETLDALESAARAARDDAFLEWDRLQTAYRDSGKERLCAELASATAELAGLEADGPLTDSDDVPGLSDAELRDRVNELSRTVDEAGGTAKAYVECARKATGSANGVELSIRTLEETRARIVTQREDALKALRSTDGAGVCPTCGRPLDEGCGDAVARAVDALRERLVALERDLDGVSARLGGLRETLEKARGERDRWLSLAEDERRRMGEATAERNTLRRAGLARRARVLRETVASLDSRIAACPDDDEVIAAQGRYQAAEETLSKALAARSETKARAEMLVRIIDTAEKAAAQYRVNTAARATLTEVRDILSQSRAQAYFMASRIRELNVSIAHYLKQAGMPFTLRLDPESRTFVVTTETGHDHPACHLSGAQRSMAALALQMAVMRVLPLRLNLYLVDEPAEALDDPNKIVMGQMFNRMRELLSSVDGTMLVVTRDLQLVSSCSQVIDTLDLEESSDE